MEPIKLSLSHGFISLGDPKDIPDSACYYQQNFVHSPILAISTRPGYLKSNTTAFAGEIMGIGYLKATRLSAKIAITSNGDVNTL
jgi:hypothetical protein